MQVIEETKTIPARTYTERKYVASNGKVFACESDCEKYEENLRIAQHPVMKSMIDVSTFEEGYSAKLYYLRNQEDHEFLCAKIVGAEPFSFDCDEFSEHGEGWYLFYSVGGGDWADDLHLYHFDTYVNGIDRRLKQWWTDIQQLIDQTEI